MIAAGIGVVIAGVVSQLGSQVKTPFTTLLNKIN
jgi:Flp pilus assembly pilin Flp